MSIKAMKQALEALENLRHSWAEARFISITSLRQAIAEAEKREWVGLTDAEIEEFDYYARDLVMDIEKALKEKNNVT